MFKIIKMSENTKEYIERFYQIFEEMRANMEAVEPSNSLAQNYIGRMLPLLNAQIAMSENILKYTTNVEIEELANAIITNSKEDVDTLTTLKESCTEESPERDVLLFEKSYQDSYNRMIANMSASASGNNLNIDFLTEITPLIEGSINISKALLKFDVCEPVKTFAENMILSQSTQLEEIKPVMRRLS